VSEESNRERLLRNLKPETRRRIVFRDQEPGSEPGPIEIMTVGPIQAEALRRQHEKKKQAEGESTGDETGGAGAGEETATNE
jgi:hypothetical protein